MGVKMAAQHGGSSFFDTLVRVLLFSQPTHLFSPNKLHRPLTPRSRQRRVEVCHDGMVNDGRNTAVNDSPSSGA